MTAPLLEVGHVIAGRYAVVGLIDARGPVAMYRAAAAGREVLLTVLDPGIKFEALAEMEQRTRALSAFLPADASAALIEAAVDPALGAPFRVFEPPTAASLADVVARERVHLAHLGPMLRGLARVLDPMHEHAIVHGALHPANVAVGPGPAVRVDGFDASVVLRAMPTPEGYAYLAPWMAPEQVRDGAVVDGRADVFAAGLLTFFAATGRSYWRSCQTDKPDLLGLHREVVAPRTPASVRASEIGVELPPYLDAALATALHVDPEQRFRTVGELAAALDQTVGAALGSIPPPPAPFTAAPPLPPPPAFAPAPVQLVQAAPVGFPPPAPAKGSKVGLVIGLVVALVLLAGGALAFFLFFRSRPSTTVDTPVAVSVPVPEVATASAAPAAPPSAAPTGDPVPVASATAEPEPPTVPATAAATAVAPAASAPPVVRPPSISSGSPSKPCGKFLKRCD